MGRRLELGRCPHCGVHRPNLQEVHRFDTTSSDADRDDMKVWAVYMCRGCGGAVIACTSKIQQHKVPIAEQVFPRLETPSEEIPAVAREYLRQAMESLHAPDGATILAASAVDAMLKDKGLVKGDLYPRIGEAREQGLITEDMAKWAHHIRLEANKPRHADEGSPHRTPKEAAQSVEFAKALGDFLYVYPARIRASREDEDEEAPQGPPEPLPPTGGNR